MGPAKPALNATLPANGGPGRRDESDLPANGGPGRRDESDLPANGGPEENLETKVFSDFEKEELDVLIYGHTHESKITHKKNLLLINPGKGYLETNFFGPPTTVVILRIHNDKVQGTIKVVKS